MRFFLSPAALVSEAAILLGLVIGKPEVAILGLIGWIASAAWLSMRAAQSRNLSGTSIEVSNANRVLIAPLRKLHSEIGSLVETNASRPAIKVIGGQALEEADRVLHGAAKVLALRDSLRKAAAGEHDAKREAEELRKEMADASGELRASLESAASAREKEIGHYAEADKAMEKIDALLRQSEAALSELKARLAAAAARADSEGDLDEGLGETVARLRTLSQSVDEAEEFVREVSA